MEKQTTQTLSMSQRRLYHRQGCPGQPGFPCALRVGYRSGLRGADHGLGHQHGGWGAPGRSRAAQLFFLKISTRNPSSTSCPPLPPAWPSKTARSSCMAGWPISTFPSSMEMPFRKSGSQPRRPGTAWKPCWEEIISGHRREYYYSLKSKYYTYITRPETVNDFTKADFKDSRFLFNLAGDYNATPEPTRARYERFLKESEKSVTPLIEVFNLPETGETRLMFNSDFEIPQVAILRNLCHDHGFEMTRAYWEPYWGKAPIPSSICSIYIHGELSKKKSGRAAQRPVRFSIPEHQPGDRAVHQRTDFVQRDAFRRQCRGFYPHVYFSGAGKRH